MDKQTLLGKIDGAWRSFQASYAGLSPAEMQSPDAAGSWSVKDILAHVTTWEEEALKNLPFILQGQRTPRYKDQYGGIDAFNDLMAERKRNLPLDEVLQQLEATHGRLVAYIAEAPEAEFVTETRFRRRIRWDTYSHYPHHEKSIREWRARLPEPAGQA
jgi:hypothetical protein